ncbi:hypothetical protein HH212_26660 (plasmid) [Massilia forsythiae]|uniref:Uncharacterized protein n=1 Tax=Massilia forsythiae TaxID=2728020 RepID=A0A7Z2W3F8_9BURK|nr:hypothetical protein [Massilia forsythiae]QJE03680.1 hypothetical protein HH212_26660 [Massilia forsythiae]
MPGPKKLSFFHSDSRKPFLEEAPVIDAAQRAVEEVAHKYGKGVGAALFKGVVQVSAAPTEHSAIKLIRGGGPASAKARQNTHPDNILTQIRAAGLTPPDRRSAFEKLNEEIDRFVRAHGIAPK